MTDDSQPFAIDGDSAPRTNTAGNVDPSAVSEAIGSGAVSWIPNRRWFGSKSRSLESVTVDDLALDLIGAETAALAIVTLHYQDGGTDQYCLPVLLTATPNGTDHIIATVIAGDQSLAIVDGPEEESFRNWFLDGLAEGRTVAAGHGIFRFEPTEVLGDYLSAARSSGSRLIRSEQSNSSVIYSDAIIGKLFRRLQPGINPDLEIGRFLTEHTDFRAAPPLVGGPTYTDDNGQDTSIAVLQTFVPSVGDAWTATLADLKAFISAATDVSTLEVPTELIDTEPARLLGLRTAQMHVALASSDTEEGFAPEPVTADDIAGWIRETVTSIEIQRSMLDNALPHLSPMQQQIVIQVDISPARLADRVEGYRALEGTSRIRVHGDYHLGQVLRSVTGDVVILDFEGEPSRSIEERRGKTAALKDVAGMLRSLRYARGASVKDYSGDLDNRIVDRWLAQWKAASREAFIGAYRAEAAHSAHQLVPTDTEAFNAALAAWELDKALYELAYEANNRPAWLDIPLMTLAM